MDLACILQTRMSTITVCGFMDIPICGTAEHQRERLLARLLQLTGSLGSSNELY